MVMAAALVALSRMAIPVPCKEKCLCALANVETRLWMMVNSVMIQLAFSVIWTTAL